MSDPGSAGGGQNPFNIFGDLARLLGESSGSLNWDVARQVTALIAGEGQSEGNVDPVQRIRIEEFVRVAQLHVEQVTGMSVVVRNVEALSHVDWAVRTLDDYQAMLTALADSLAQSHGGDAEETDFSGGAIPGFGDMQKFLTPVLLGILVGGMLGHLSRKTLGQYDLPIPRGQNESLVFVTSNIEQFASDWSLPSDELNLYVAVEEVTRHALFQRAHVRSRFSELITQYVSMFRADDGSLMQQLSGLDMENPEDLPAALSNPEALLGAMQTPEQRTVMAQLSALVAAFVGYVDWVASQIGPKIIPTGGAIAEANKRRRVEESDGARLVERMLGLELTQPQFDRGANFINGILERNGEEGLARLWKSANELPTPAEVDAPGLWLARIDLSE
jgi:putative hydrolase